MQKRKDSAFSAETASTAITATADVTVNAPKTRDFAVALLAERDSNMTSKSTNTPRPTAPAAAVTIKANNENGSSVWRKLKISGFSKLAGKA